MRALYSQKPGLPIVHSMIAFLLFWGLNLLASLVALLHEPEDPRFADDKLIYHS